MSESSGEAGGRKDEAVVTVRREDDGDEQSVVLGGAGSASLSACGLVGFVEVRVSKACFGTLKEVSLASNAITEVDLTALSSCTALESVVLNSNSIRSIDLGPLRSCTRLQKLWLHRNKLASVDLSALSECAQLRSLYLDDNCMHSAGAIELAPLSQCRSLRSLRLGGNKLGGTLDVSALKNSSSLAMMDIGAQVKLQVMGENMTAQALPPALRRRSAQIEWMQPDDSCSESVKSIGDETKATAAATTASRSESPRRSCLLLGFEAHSLGAFYALFSTTMNVVMAGKLLDSRFSPNSGNRGVASNNGKTALHPATQLSFDIVVAEASCASEALEICAAGSKNVPVVLVVRQLQDIGETPLADTGSEAFAAVMCTPLDTNAARIVRDLAEEGAKMPSISRIGSAADLHKRSGSASRLEVDFSVLRAQAYRARWVQKHDARTTRDELTLSDSLRCGLPSSGRMDTEESALRLWLRRLGGSVRSEHWKSLATLFGLPNCCTEFLRKSVLLHTSDGEADQTFGYDVGTERVLAFWLHWMKSSCRELRLFTVLALSTGNKQLSTVSQDAFRELLIAAKTYLDRTLRMQQASSLATADIVRSSMISAVGQLLLGTNGECVPDKISASHFVKAKVCEALHAIESGTGASALRWLRFNQLEEVCSEFDRCAANAVGRGAHQLSTLTSKSCFLEFCMLRRLVVPEAAALLYDRFFKVRQTSHRYYGHSVQKNDMGLKVGSFTEPEHDVAAFGCFYMACQDLESSLYADYWFSVLDADGDGLVSLLDLSVWWNVKVWFMRDEQRNDIPSLEWLCIWLRDAMCAGGEFVLQEPLGLWSDLYLSRAAFRSLADLDRGFMLRALLFCDDEIETSSVSAQAVAPMSSSISSRMRMRSSNASTSAAVPVSGGTPCSTSAARIATTNALAPLSE
eukprot:CAMPEP_0185845530 /NCGR_PEP_ID=MMETSP1354-20130828/1477_1 /TAXON_ID=708628 /ORGANISM="Erythrolobus madagascarensis, Strain CCMP3276" /LENGTH=917 /DNA_ID=CAMNT_0028545517 /DNA_START=185 /DNA_END=2941 /DNA_ORIENTATION=+